MEEPQPAYGVSGAPQAAPSSILRSTPARTLSSRLSRLLTVRDLTPECIRQALIARDELENPSKIARFAPLQRIQQSSRGHRDPAHWARPPLAQAEAAPNTEHVSCVLRLASVFASFIGFLRLSYRMVASQARATKIPVSSCTDFCTRARGGFSRTKFHFLDLQA